MSSDINAIKEMSSKLPIFIYRTKANLITIYTENSGKNFNCLL